MIPSIITILLFSLTTCYAIPPPLPLIQSNQLRRVLTQSSLRAHGQKFMNFASLSPEKSRAFGTVGHNLTLAYIKEKLDSTGYYDTQLQTFEHLFSQGKAEFSVKGGKTYNTGWFTYGPSGNVTEKVVNVEALGCELKNFPTEVKGKIALISRGTCEFGLKVALAGASGAKGVIIYNNLPGPISGTLASPSRPQGPYVPVGSLSLEDGSALALAAANGNVIGTLGVVAVTEMRTTSNIIATTNLGDKDNIVFAGAHTDSVPAGPGMNDNGSGTIGLLEVALKLPKWSVKNAVRFGWWTAEEFGLVGAEYYVKSLSIEERLKIALYINVDMIASPNFAYFVYDGDGSAFNISGPPGSGHIEELYEEYFTEVGLGSRPTAFSGRSDYGPFLDVGIPCGGLFTGAEQLKTPEEAALWGGQAGVAYDINYHQPGDTLENTNLGAWIQNTKALAHSMATYARSLEGFPREAGRGAEVNLVNGHICRYGCI
ncbi:Zn-dependent exopeptidase [Wilcoxina mikolae CBS 423.85]|nr:Zn-dependent exopeptidase [Wilcoxina mikolae CBS 423.85]